MTVTRGKIVLAAGSDGAVLTGADVAGAVGTAVGGAVGTAVGGAVGTAVGATSCLVAVGEPQPCPEMSGSR